MSQSTQEENTELIQGRHRAKGDSSRRKGGDVGAGRSRDSTADSLSVASNGESLHICSQEICSELCLRSVPQQRVGFTAARRGRGQVRRLVRLPGER